MHRHIPHVMIAVFDAPMLANASAAYLSIQHRGGNIPGYLGGILPVLGRGVKHESCPQNFQDGLNRVVPLYRIGQRKIGEDFHLAGFDAIASFGDRLLIGVIRLRCVRSALAILQQIGLIGLDLHNHLIGTVFRRVERLFLTMQGIGREDTIGESGVLESLLDQRNLIGLLRQIQMC